MVITLFSFSNCSEKFIGVDFEKYRISEAVEMGSGEFIIDKVRLKIINNELILKGKVCSPPCDEFPFEGAFLIRKNNLCLIDTIGVTNQKGLFDVKFLLNKVENDTLIFSYPLFRDYKFDISKIVNEHKKDF